MSDIAVKLQTLPNQPGIYKFYALDKQLLYIGKAKDLKKRVSSYFQKEHDNKRLQVMVKKIHDIEIITVTTEQDALLLENALIKSLQPRYNINLKDDKTYPWIVLTKERFPKVFYTRKKGIAEFEYYGPFSSIVSIRTLLDVIKEIFPLRTCSHILSEENIKKNKFKACLDYHIGKCKAPCIGLQTEEEYNHNINQIKKIIKGQIKDVIIYLKENLQNHINKLEFEKAHEVKTKLNILEKYQAKSQVVSSDIKDADIFNILMINQQAYGGYFKVTNGFIIQTYIVEADNFIGENQEDILERIISEIRQKFNSQSKEIILPFDVQFQLSDIKYIIPKQGERKKLLDLIYQNLENYASEKQKQLSIINPEEYTNKLMQQMKNDLRMTKEPRRIEAFDNSNIQGTNAVSAMSVFIDGKPAKSEYRHFNVKTVTDNPDDFATMYEVIHRRYERVINDHLPMPDLIVIDGGKGQLSAGLKALDDLNIREKVSIISIAKRLEEIFFPNDSVPLYLDKRSPTLKVIQHIRNEVHRFGITHHRKRRSKHAFQSELLNIKGIKEKTAIKLLQEFGSVQQIKVQSLDILSACVGKSKAQIILDYFNNTTTN